MRGKVADLEFVRRVAGGPAIGTKPKRIDEDGRTIIAYTRTRLHLDRGAWEALPSGGILLVQVIETSGARAAFAFTADELASYFGHVRQTASWADARYYCWPTLPHKAMPFAVRLDGRTATPILSEAAPAPMQKRRTPAAPSEPSRRSATPPSIRPKNTALPLPPAGARAVEWAQDVERCLGGGHQGRAQDPHGDAGDVAAVDVKDEVAFVQFPHPGGEANPIDSLVPWNRGDHSRKFMRGRGVYSCCGDLRRGDFSFWGEWEAQSRIIERFAAADPGMPRNLHDPYWSEPEGGWRQNTDPLVFGERFLYSNCRQRRNKKLRHLAPGSLILFGSSRDGEFVLDTAFVVGSAEQYAPGITQVAAPPLVEQVVLAPLAMGDERGSLLRLYRGRMQSAAPEGPFCFVPCRPDESRPSRFARPVIQLGENWLSPNLSMAAKVTPASSGAISEIWGEVVRQVEAAGHALAVQIGEPPHRHEH